MCASLYVVTVGKTVGPCVAMLCVDVDTVHGCCKTTALPYFAANKFTAQEVQSEAKMSRKQKRNQIGTKLSQSFILCI